MIATLLQGPYLVITVACQFEKPPYFTEPLHVLLKKMNA